MAISFKSGSARLYAQRYIISGLRQGLSANQIYSNLTSAGVSYRRGSSTDPNSFYGDVARYNDNLGAASLRGLSKLPGMVGNVAEFSIPTARKRGIVYNYPIVIHGTNIDTGEPIDINFSFNSGTKIINALLPSAIQVAWDNFLKQPQSNIRFNPESDVTMLPVRRFYSTNTL